MNDRAERRRRRREIRLLQSESSWLQKALFALRKAEAEREKLSDVRDEEPEDYTLDVGGSDLPLEALEDALDERIQAQLSDIRERRKQLR